MIPPPAPWRLKGEALVCISRPPLANIRQQLPTSLKPISFAGRGLSALYLARYDEGSTLRYHELIVATLVRERWRWGAWISVINVDLMLSLVGGRTIWHLPKQMADFHWSDREISVSAADVLLCKLSTKRGGGVQSPLFAPVLSQSGGKLARFYVHGRAKIARRRAVIEVPNDSPLHAYEFHRCTSVFSLTRLDGTISAPHF